ncbi:hypothetical protein GCM10011351_01390 [Paraliobacillus quinghaiensis]|uniref:SHOCT domain-containing protein n=1 Tax=Paraliobacillus quinghaiensis TaxID=470815 RepID=A0A917TDI3_9BACI|nr:SHOCT domain-containing protein [Paraliobacillus quinghaiensis]GGM19243.1 hypothetical protein GCM10011351_01390 [Paraliobacillus quinghaiensis]
MMHQTMFAPMIWFFILWSVLILIGAILVMNYLTGGRENPSVQILKERLAKGEITEEEYNRLKKILKQDK